MRCPFCQGWADRNGPNQIKCRQCHCLSRFDFGETDRFDRFAHWVVAKFGPATMARWARGFISERLYSALDLWSLSFFLIAAIGPRAWLPWAIAGVWAAAHLWARREPVDVCEACKRPLVDGLCPWISEGRLPECDILEPSPAT